MKLKYLKQESLFTLSSNQPVVYKNMKEFQSNLWVQEYLGKDCFLTSKIEIGNIKMDCTFKNPIDGDFKNAKIIYEALKNLNETQATDERIWSGLAFGECYDYLVYRWGLDNITKLRYRWLFYMTGRRKLFYNGISRLWWFAKMTYDDKFEDPYMLTEFVYKHPQIMKAMTYRNYSNSDHLRKAILMGMYKYSSEGNQLTISIIDDIYKHISQLGSASLLDGYEFNDLTNNIYFKLLTISK